MEEIRPRLPKHLAPFISDLKQMSVENVVQLFGNITSTTTETNQYEAKGVLTAFDGNGGIMPIEEYCDFYGLDRTKVRSSKLVTHTGVPFYNIAFDDREELEGIDLDEVRSSIESIISKDVFVPKSVAGDKVGVVKIADLHLGALIENLIKSKDYSVSILSERLVKASEIINRMNYKEVHVHILGDLIESFTGLSHINSWKNMEKGMYGAEAVKACANILHKCFLSRINNLATVKIIAGNHDRVTSNNSEDVSGDAGNLIAWGLELMGYDVEFNISVLTHLVDGINHINTHGHLGISRKTTKEICWDYGEQGVFNLISEGHLHSIIQKLSVAQRQKFQTTKDASVDHLRFNCPSFFTGNDFSEYLGYTSSAGFVIIENNGEGVPHQFNFSL